MRLRSGTNWSNYTLITTFKDLTFDTKYQDVGAFSFTVKQDLASQLNLADDSIIEIAPNGSSHYNLWFAVDGTNGSTTADDTKWKTLSGKSIINWLKDAIVYPSSWPTLPVVNPDGTTTPIISGHSFQNATPGNILRTLIARAKESERGGLTWLDETSFTGTTTTDNVAWATTLTVTYPTGTTLLQVVQDLSNRRLIQFRMNGMQLQVFNYDSQISHKTPEQVTFRSGKSISEQTTNTDSSASASVILIQGDETSIAEVNTLPDGSSPTITRRREMFVAQGGITDTPTLQFLAKAQLAISGHIKAEESLGVLDNLLPWTDYDVGDWVWEDSNGTLQNIQIKQISASAQDANNLSIGLTLGDMLDDLDSQFQQKIDNISGQNSGNYGGLPNQIKNFLAPSPPTGVTATPTAYRDSNGLDNAQITITWAAPVTNVDGSALSDLDRYEVQYQAVGATAWQQAANVPASRTSAYISALPSGMNFTCQVRAVDTDGNASTWAVLATPIVLPKVTIIPATPSTPTVSSVFQSIEVTWNGLTSTGAGYGVEWARTDIYIGTTSTFTPTTAAGSFTRRGGVFTVGGLAYSTTYYVKLIAVDKSGNQSAASTASSAITAAQLSDPDLPAKLITGAKIADGTINTTQLTVASFGDSVAPNGGFEDTNSATSTGASHWYNSFYSAAGFVSSVATSGAATGNNCLKISTPGSVAAGSSLYVVNEEVPTAPGDLWYIKGKIKADRAQTQAGSLILAFGQPGAGALPIILDGNNPVIGVINLIPATTTWTEFEGQLLVPSGTTPNPVNRMICIVATLSDGTTNNIYWDDIAVRPVGGSASIKDASIINAKIANVSADKITVGTLNADILVGARIKTADTGARVELNNLGLQGYDTSSNQTFNLSDLDGSLVMSGSLQGGSMDFPAAAAASSFRLHADQNGMLVQSSGITNLVTDPSFESTTPITVTTKDTHTSTRFITSTIQAGVPYSGNTALEVWTDGTDASGWMEINVAASSLQPSTVYCLSFYAGPTVDTSYTTNPGSPPTTTPNPACANFANLLGRVGSTVLFTGADGYYDYNNTQTGQTPIFPPSSTGAYNGSGVSLGGSYTMSSSGGLHAVVQAQAWPSSSAGYTNGMNATTTILRRWFKAFKTPSTIAANSTLILRLPAPNISGNAQNGTNLRIAYDELQLEVGVLIPSLLADGDLPDSTWTGTPYASTSLRGSAGVKTLMQLSPSTAPKFPVGLSRGSGKSFGTNTITRTRNASWSLVVNSQVVLPLDTTVNAVQDDGTLYNTSTPAFVCPVDGFYSMSCTQYFPTAASYQAVMWYNTSGQKLAENNGAGITGAVVTCSYSEWLSAGTQIQPVIRSNVAQSMVANSNSTPSRASIGLIA